MPASALGLALAAAAVHAGWNLLLARQRDTEATTAVAFACFVVALAPVALATWRVEAGAWPFIAASAVLELAYLGLLAAAYRRFELSLVYPLARGLAPVLALAIVAVVATAFPSALEVAGVMLREPVGPRRLAGAALVVAGIALLTVA